jgi:oligoribonuclease NrnB/cAMP/cGMP phosphodiesterase (DHH superfamily)
MFCANSRIEIQTMIQKLESIRDDIDAIDHHQTDRIVAEIDEVVVSLKKSETSSHS